MRFDETRRNDGESLANSGLAKSQSRRERMAVDVVTTQGDSNTDIEDACNNVANLSARA